MKFFLRLKHWQLFLITWGIPIILDIFTFSEPMLLFKLFPYMMAAFVFGIFGWIWAIATVLHRKLPAGANLSLMQFKFLFLIPLIYMFGIIVWMGYTFGGGT